MELCAAKEKQYAMSSGKINAVALIMYYQWIVNNKGIIVPGYT